MNPFFKLLGINKILIDFENNVKDFGWFLANRKFIEDLHISIASNLTSFPKKGGLIVYANHPTGIDPYLISSLLGRDDVYFLGDVYQTLKGKNIASHILPIYYSNLFDIFNRPFLSWIGFIVMRIKTGLVSDEVAKNKNRESIKKAIELLKQGKVMLIFPSGGDKESRPWKTGIGKIMLDCRKQRIQIKLFKCKINNLSDFSLLKNSFSGKLYFRENPVKVNGCFVNLENYKHENDVYKITQELKSKFFKEE